MIRSVSNKFLLSLLINHVLCSLGRLWEWPLSTARTTSSSGRGFSFPPGQVSRSERGAHCRTTCCCRTKLDRLGRKVESPQGRVAGKLRVPDVPADLPGPAVMVRTPEDHAVVGGEGFFGGWSSAAEDGARKCQGRDWGQRGQLQSIGKIRIWIVDIQIFKLFFVYNPDSETFDGSKNLLMFNCSTWKMNQGHNQEFQ